LRAWRKVMLILHLRFVIVMMDTWRVKRCIIIIIIIMAAYRWVYDSRHLQADCREPGSAPEPYARQSSTGYLHFLRRFISKMHDRPIGHCDTVRLSILWTTCRISRSTRRSMHAVVRVVSEMFLRQNCAGPFHVIDNN